MKLLKNYLEFSIENIAKLRIFFLKFKKILENLETLLKNSQEFIKINSLIVLIKTLLFKLF